MKKFYSVVIMLLLISFTYKVFAQNNHYEAKLDSMLKNFGKPSQFVLKGHVSNFKEKFIELGISSYLDDQLVTLNIDKNGNFNQSFTVAGAQRLAFLIDSSLIDFTVAERDTLNIYWDQLKTMETFTAKSNSTYRNALIQTEILLNNKISNDYIDLMSNGLSRKNQTSAQQKYNMVNVLYNRCIQIILQEEKKYPDLVKKMRRPFENLIAQQYFSYSKILNSNKLLEREGLKITDKDLLNSLKDSITYNGKIYRMLRYSLLDTIGNGYKTANEHYLSNIPAYRDFLFDYIRFNGDLFTRSIPIVPNPSALVKINFVMGSYEKAKLFLNSNLIKDWFMTRLLTHGFGHYDFNDVKTVYDLYLPQYRTAFFKEAMIQNYEAVKNLKPGLIAPNFSLKDVNGKSVSISDFKGKVIYMDFWGVSCGPCIYEFENHLSQFKSRYKGSDIIYIYICVDADEIEWKKGIKKYNLEGINLIAPGWTSNPACQMYNVSGIPHYIIINKDGTIANNNAPRTSELLNKSGQNEIDLALKKL